MNQKERAAHFRRLHENRPLILPNAWDAASARVIEQAGAPAIATTSAAVSWTLGRGDGQKVTRDEMLQVIRAIARTVEVPVTADVEGGYGTGSVQDVAETVREVVAAGVAGINLEDTPGVNGETLLAPEAHAERIRAARQAAEDAGGDLVVNARVDVYLFQVGAPETRFDEAVRRARIYREAGADCLFVPGVLDAETIGALVRAIDGPLNVMAKPGAPDMREMGRLGVARVSLGPALALAALTAARQAVRELLEQGTYQSLERSLSFVEVNGLFSHREG